MRLLKLGGIMRELKNTILGIMFFLMLALFVGGCEKKKEITTIIPKDNFVGKKVLYLDSYHENYASNILTRSSFEEGIGGRGIEVRYEYLDSKLVKDTIELQKKAQTFKGIVAEWQPDLIVAADDAINKYLISPYYKNSPIPVVFIGVNWTAESYGYPTDNITGQLEVELVEKLIADLKKYGSGDRVGILTGNTFTDRKNIYHYKNILNISFEKEILVDSFSEWKESFMNIQDSVDILFLRGTSGINGWDESEAVRFVNLHTKIPTGSINTALDRYVLLSYPKMNSEFGEYAAKTTLKILDGTSPKALPVTHNKKTIMTINTIIAERLGVRFPADMMEIAHIVSNVKKVLFINSYHQGYEWSDGIEKGVLKSFGITAAPPYKSGYSSNDIELRITRMDTKRNQDPAYMQQKSLEVKNFIDTWGPDVVIAADDNAAKHLVAEYYKNSSIPFLFCGVNWDASVYGFPTKNISGMVEVAPVMELIEFLKQYAEGSDIAYLGANVVSERKEMNHYKDVLDIKFKNGYLVDSFDEWKEAYIELQNSADILIILNPVSVQGWDQSAAEVFVVDNSRIPSGTTSKMLRALALISFSRLAEEQGMWSGRKALEILAGTSVEGIPIVRNTRSSRFLNMKLAKKLNVVFPPAVMDSVNLVEEDK